MMKRSAIVLAVFAAAAVIPAAYADQEPAIVPVSQQQASAPAVEMAPETQPQAAPVVEVSSSAPAPEAPERASGCSAQRPSREGLALVLVPFDFGRQALRSLRGIFVSC